MPFKANNNREAVVVCARHVVKRPSKRSVLVYIYIQWCSPNSNCSNSNIALLASYFLSPSEHLMLILFLE